MCENKIAHHLRQLVLGSKSETVRNMSYDHLSAFFGSKPVVELGAEALVLHEALRIGSLPDVMIHCSGTHKKHVRVNAPRSRISKVHHLK